MKYTIDDILNDETKKIDVSEFFPKATERVIMKTKRLAAKYQYHITRAMEGAEFKGEKEYMDARKMILLNGIVMDDDFPIDKWDSETIDWLEENRGKFIDFLIIEISEFNRPLALRKQTNSSSL